MAKTDLFCRQHVAIFLVVFPYVDHSIAIEFIDRDTTLIRYLYSPSVSFHPLDSVLSLVSSSLLL